MMNQIWRAAQVACLIAEIHLVALMRFPGAYLKAAKWRILGKRVRARAQFARLLALTPRAYNYWVLRSGSEELKSHSDSPAIIALVDGRHNREATSVTLQSLKEQGIEAFVIDAADPVSDLKSAARAIDWAQCPWLFPLAAGDLLAPSMASEYRSSIEKANKAVVYADDDLLTKRNHRESPHFKPDWNSELFAFHDYLTEACVVQLKAHEFLLCVNAEGWARALVIKALDNGGGAVHLRKMLHHRIARAEPNLPPPRLAYSSNLPSVSVIVPTRNRLDLLSTCIEGLRATDYPMLDVIVVDNDSDDQATLDYLSHLECEGLRVLRHPGDFNYSEINNRAARIANGQLICLLNNDIEVRNPDWLSTLAIQAIREKVGAVGAQLLYADGRIQHAGVVIGVGNAAGHAHRFLDPSAEGYFNRHALPQFVTAVTAACLLVEKEKFDAVGGLDGESFPIAFNDVDLCLKLNQRGWQSFYEPRAVLVHHESVSRGFDTDPIGRVRFARELAALQRRWNTDTVTDPFHHPALSRATEQFALELQGV